MKDPVPLSKLKIKPAKALSSVQLTMCCISVPANVEFVELSCHFGFSESPAAAGKYGRAMQFDGSNDYVNISDDPIFDIDDGAISFWFKSPFTIDDSHPSTFFVLSKNLGGVNDGDLIFEWRGSDGNLGLEINGASTEYEIYSDSNTWTLDTWYHVVGIWGSGGMSMYIDGIKQTDTNAYSGNAMDNSAPLMIAAHSAGNFNFNGLVDEVRIWNRSLSASEIQQLYFLNPLQLLLSQSFFLLSDSNYCLYHLQMPDKYSFQYLILLLNSLIGSHTTTIYLYHIYLSS